MKYIIGADGGGTKTILAAANLYGSIVARAQTAGINYNFIGYKAASEHFIAGIRTLGIDSDDIAAIAVGDPSTDDIDPAPGTADFIASLRQNIPLKAEVPLLIRSDAFMALYGLTAGKAGVLIISGTGAMGMAFDESGQIHIAGGWGRITEDEGSGYYIAVSGLKAALRFHDGIGPPTLLSDAMADFYGEKNPRRLIYSFYENPGTPPDIASFSAAVSKCAAAGDKQAESILRDAAGFLSSYTASLVKRIKNDRCKIGIYGSVLTKDSYIRNMYTENVGRLFPKARILIPETTPEAAAVLYALNHLNDANPRSTQNTDV